MTTCACGKVLTDDWKYLEHVAIEHPEKWRNATNSGARRYMEHRLAQYQRRPPT